MGSVLVADGRQRADGSHVCDLLYVFHLAQRAPLAARELQTGMGLVALARYLVGTDPRYRIHRTRGEHRDRRRSGFQPLCTRSRD